ncbi:MAG: DoxX family protein [Cyclobacteriaceae bacterium]|nr:DoxX family protein [Cyclobacteriaceae bacterium]
MKYVQLLGRALFSLIFLLSPAKHFSTPTIAYAASQGVPFANLLVPASGIMALLGAISIIIGYKARIGSILLVAFLLPITFTIHNFWAISDPIFSELQNAMFMKNISMMGAALFIGHTGTGSLSIENTKNDYR